MAEGFARHYWGDQVDVRSAGIVKHGLNPLAVRAMREIGIDISGNSSKTIDELGTFVPDSVITVCDHANESCPVFPGQVERIHAGFDDPPKLASAAASDEDAMPHYRRVRDEIGAFIRDFPRFRKDSR